MLKTTLSIGSLYAILSTFNNSENSCRIKVKCRGFSMAPAINNNDLVVINPSFSSNLLRIGTIVVAAFPEKKRLIVHRIIKAEQHEVLIKGDNIKVPDGWINSSQIIGVIEMVSKSQLSYNCYPWIGFIMAQFSKAGFLTFLNKSIFYSSRLRSYLGSITIY